MDISSQLLLCSNGPGNIVNTRLTIQEWNLIVSERKRREREPLERKQRAQLEKIKLLDDKIFLQRQEIIRSAYQSANQDRERDRLLQSLYSLNDRKPITCWTSIGRIIKRREYKKQELQPFIDCLKGKQFSIHIAPTGTLKSAKHGVNIFYDIVNLTPEGPSIPKLTLGEQGEHNSHIILEEKNTGDLEPITQDSVSKFKFVSGREPNINLKEELNIFFGNDNNDKRQVLTRDLTDVLQTLILTQSPRRNMLSILQDDVNVDVEQNQWVPRVPNNNWRVFQLKNFSEPSCAYLS